MSDIPLFNETGPCSEFLGFIACQNRMAVPAWSYAMEILRPKTVIELGTYDGGFSVPLAIACKNFGAHFVTYDRNAYNLNLKWWFESLKIDFRLRPDILSPECLAEIGGLINGPGVSMVLCDGGDKKREFHVMARFLRSGDVIGAHDFMDVGTYWRSCEITSEDVLGICSELNLMPWNQEIFERAAWLVRRKL